MYKKKYNRPLLENYIVRYNIKNVTFSPDQNINSHSTITGDCPAIDCVKKFRKKFSYLVKNGPWCQTHRRQKGRKCKREFDPADFIVDDNEAVESEKKTEVMTMAELTELCHLRGIIISKINNLPFLDRKTSLFVMCTTQKCSNTKRVTIGEILDSFITEFLCIDCCIRKYFLSTYVRD